MYPLQPVKIFIVIDNFLSLIKDISFIHIIPIY